MGSTGSIRIGAMPVALDAGVVPILKKSAPRSFIGVRRMATLLAGCMGLTVLAGYVFQLQATPYWPAELARTRPYTAICLVLLALGMAPLPKRGSWLHRGACFALLTLIAMMLAKLAFLLVSTRSATPMVGPDAAYSWWAVDTSYSMKPNIAGALLLLSVGELLRRSLYPRISQILACGALALMLLAVTGVLAELSPFWGSVGLPSLFGIVALSTALLLGTARHGFMRAVTAPTEPGRLARTLLGGSTVLLVLTGWVVSYRIDNPGIPLPADGTLLVSATVFAIGLTWVVIAVSIMRADRHFRLRRVAQRLLERTARRDALTGLLNRDSVAALRAANLANHLPSASLFIDIDRFRSVNEALGSAQGDLVLKEVARRLVAISKGASVGRLGGDEFAIYMGGVALTEAELMGAEVVAELARPFVMEDQHFRLTASVGIAHTDSAGETDLRQAADDAMYVAKARGGNQSVVFTRSMHDIRQQDVELEQSLHKALISDEELELFYQPVVSVKDRKLVAVEALARWRHPQLGMIPPDRFILLAEKVGLMAILGRKLMRLAVQQAAAWETSRPGQVPVLNINVSPVQFAEGDVIADLAAIVHSHGLTENRFCIEVTESVFATPAATVALLQAREMGFKVAMDDFGVGYSTLSQLPRLPLTSVKLDRSFIVHATESHGDAVMFSAVTQLVHALGPMLVAEGIETESQWDLIAESGCDAAQGYLIAKPMDAPAFAAWQEKRLVGTVV
ncbi:bifunctional diguanylate cyclase/phosphodiesterase [Rhodoferax sp. OV413]|uniref:putative bifunctional diguanylate cyclase/phosphodiesterase n=1 Tax=Rhodoferax sp. OV413 TaxID=1855285 RepID=UPI000B8A3F45|nr:GGDEF domain-containing phosphodiesterase [Rhodoferax sp. OV413]